MSSPRYPSLSHQKLPSDPPAEHLGTSRHLEPRASSRGPPIHRDDHDDDESDYYDVTDESARAIPKMAPKERQVEDGVLDDTDYKPTDWRKLFQKKYIPYHIIGLAIIGVTIWMSVKHDQIVDTLRPFSKQVRDLPAGFLIPIAILIIISVPPLFGHEIIGLLCGVVYGLWVGFAILAAGTFLGEVLTFYLFKYVFRKKAMKLERTNLTYAALVRLINAGGFWRRFAIVTIIRFSAMPAHLSTAVFATCGISFWVFAVATAVTLPKQLFLVYLGVLFEEGSNNDNKAKTIMFCIAGLLTVLAAGWVIWKMRDIKTVLVEEQTQRRAQREMNLVKPPSIRTNPESLQEPYGGSSQSIPPRSQYQAPGVYQYASSVDDLSRTEATPFRMV